MRRLVLFFLATSAISVNLVAQPEGPPTVQQLNEISARGKALAEYDQAAWHASDAVEAAHPAAGTVQRYVARKTESGWVVDWGYFNPDHTGFLITFEAKQGANPTVYTVTKRDPPINDTDYIFNAASALEAAKKDFLASSHSARPYNISVLPTTDGQWYVYAIPAQTDLAILPYGGDIRYTISKDGLNIHDRRMMHQSVLEESLPKDDQRPEFDFHTHILSNIPEDSDIFYAVTRKTELGEWVITEKYAYDITPTFSIDYLGETKQVADILSRGDCKDLPASLSFCVYAADLTKLAALSALWRVTGILHEAWPLRPSASFENAHCKDGAIWLTLTVSLRNVGDKDLIISRAVAGNWTQARFANNPADLIAGNYDKLVFAAIDPQSNPSKDDSFAPLAPGKEIQTRNEVFLADLNPKGKTVVQFLVFAGFPGDEKPPKELLDRYRDAGTFFTDSVLTDLQPFALDPKLVETCKK
jgi:hypothetical protein